jgi:Zn-dependent M16 (insulinase) family peptidase
LHQVEIQNKKPKANFGLSLLYSQMANLNHGVSIPASLDLSNTIKQIRENVKKGLFEGLIKKYILDN